MGTRGKGRIPSSVALALALAALTLFSATSVAQISVTQSQFYNIFTPGSSHTYMNSDTTVPAIDIGKPGGPNVYDFTGISSGDTGTSNNYQVSSLPIIAARYPGDAITFGYAPDSIDNNPVFLFRSDTMYNLGEASMIPEYRFKHYVPPSPLAVFPLAYLQQRTYSYTYYDTTYNASWGVVSSEQHSGTDSAVVDGYGTLKVPGFTVECLRVKLNHATFGDKEFMYFTREGIFVDVGFAASADPDSGLVQGASFMLIKAQTLTDVPKFELPPSGFSLAQNYPNPFNPATTIQYSLPLQSRVRVEVIDVLGRVVAELFDGDQAAGIHTLRWNAGVPSGIYFCRLEAMPEGGQRGAVMELRKMVLLK